MDNNNPLRNKIMEAIQAGHVHMRPRWQFVVIAILSSIGAFVLLLVLIYTVSLIVFSLRESGAWFLPAFGGRGWFDFFRSLPWFLISVLVLLGLVLEFLVKKYSFVYKKPILISVAGIMLLMAFGGFGLAQTSLHAQMAFLARHNVLPEPLMGLYKPPFRLRPDDVYHGRIVARTNDGFILSDRGESTTTVVITRHTRLPFGENFEPGDAVVVIGDSIGTSTDSDTIEAFGIREVRIESRERD